MILICFESSSNAIATDTSAPPRPNIVLILCDDLGYADVGFNGSKDIKTPALDRLARNGTIFSSAYVPHPFCGPSRMGMMTGRYPHSLGTPFNLPNSGRGIVAYNRQGVPATETLISTVLQKAGYYTGAIGKWHMGIDAPFHPNRRGFDDYYGFLGGGHKYFPKEYGLAYERQRKDGIENINEYLLPLEHNGKKVEETEYMTDALSREAARFVSEAAEKDTPFFLYLAFNAPHTPLEAKPEDLAKFVHIADERRRNYAAMVYAVDRGIQRLVDSLKSTKEFDDTLIIFLSDNGGKVGAGADNGQLREGKGSVCEGGIRVPMFFHWPKVISSQNRFEHPVSGLDLFPTFARLAGATIPKQKKLDGKDIWDALLENRSPRPTESLFALRHRPGVHDVGVRRDQWKITRRGPNATWSLFNLDEDLCESKDLSARHADIVSELLGDAESWSRTHLPPRWFDDLESEQAWRDDNMPRYVETFALNDGSPTTTNESPKTQKPTKKQAASDWTRAEYIAAEKKKWAKNGWRWNVEKVEANFADVDEDNDGLATATERKQWYAKRAAEREKAATKSTVTPAMRSKAKGKPNILFIAIDDLRPELGCYGSEIAITPHLDAIAKDGLLFNRAYCQQAICSPSRASLMTGARPDTIGVIENYTYFRDVNPNIVTLPQHFLENGYETVNVGKIYHGKFNDPEKSWSRLPAVQQLSKRFPKPIGVGGYALPENRKIVADKRKQFGANAHSALLKGPAYEAADVTDQTFEDGYNADLAIVTLKDMLNQKQQPFFLGLGFKKPHLNFVCPKRYWDLYDPEKLPAGTYTQAPDAGAAMGLHASFELRTRDGIPKEGPIDPALSRTLLHGYLACTSYVDAQIGRVVAALEEQGLRDNTIIIIWGDHGWHLGDMGIWGKATNYEIATRVPLMIWTPNMPAKTRGSKTDALVELVDMYPTLCELTGLNQPDHLEGDSFAPLLLDPKRRWKQATFSQYPNPALREWAANPITPDMRELFFGPLIENVEKRIIKQQRTKWNRDLFEKHLMGYSMRTDRYRIVAWRDHRAPDSEPLFIELYDHKTDPSETKNLASSRMPIVNQLLEQLEAGWKPIQSR